MSFDLATAGEELESYLRDNVPQGWKVQGSDVALGKTTAVVLTYAQSNVSADINGVDLPSGHIALAYTLWLSTPETDSKKGFPRLNREAAELFAALDACPDLTWTTAERGIADTGESMYTLPIQVLATYTPKD